MVKKTVVKSVGRILSSPPKTGILIEAEEKPRTFSELQKKLELSSGNLNYHLLRLATEGLLAKDPENRYSITPLGRDVAQIIKQVLEASREVEI